MSVGRVYKQLEKIFLTRGMFLFQGGWNSVSEGILRPHQDDSRRFIEHAYYPTAVRDKPTDG